MSNASVLSQMTALQANLRRLTRVPSQVAKRSAVRIKIVIDLNTSSGLDAYGKPFAPLAAATVRKGRRPPPMIDTGRSLDETRVYPLGGAGIGIELGGWYSYHVQSTDNRPARSVLPERAGLPRTWNEALQQEEFSAIRSACPELTRST